MPTNGQPTISGMSDGEFSKRLDQAQAREGMDNAEFVRRLGGDAAGAPQKVTNWRKRGRIGGPSIPLVRSILTRTNMDWLNEGIGQPEREAAVKYQVREVRPTSQNEEVTPAILSRAEFWVRVEERAKGEFPPVRRAERILELCRLIRANNGDLLPEQALGLIGPPRPRRG